MARSEKPGPPKGEAYGIAAVTQALQGLDFPCSKDDLLKRAGDRSIAYRKGQIVKLQNVIQGCHQDQFPSMANVISCISDALHEKGLTGEERKAA